MTYVPSAPLTRRTVIGAACVGCATLVAGCGGGDDDAAAPATSGSSSAAPSTSTSTPASAGSGGSAPLADLADIQVGGAVSAQADGKKIIIVRTGEATATAFDATCPHQGCQVMPAGTELDCPCHGSRFSTDGAVLQGPAKKGLTPFAVTVSGGSVVAA